MKTKKSVVKNLKAYKAGELERRPWGAYMVTASGTRENGEEYCEKIIHINPGQILSLQSHDHRRERWTVQAGILTVVLDGRRLDLKEGESLAIPLGSIHSMANIIPVPCRVFERQEGICREEDIKRYADIYGRATAGIFDNNIKQSIERYNEILKEIGQEGI